MLRSCVLDIKPSTNGMTLTQRSSRANFFSFNLVRIDGYHFQESSTMLWNFTSINIQNLERK